MGCGGVEGGASAGVIGWEWVKGGVNVEGQGFVARD